MPAEPGRTGSITLIVSDADTAIALHSGDVPVLGTPRVISLCEEAAVLAIAGSLEPNETSVAARIQLHHLAPVAVGETVVAEAKLEKIQGRRLMFAISVNDDRGLVATGKTTRVVVDRHRFLDQ